MSNLNEFQGVSLYAFWSYDLFPYILGGTVTKINELGRVETVEFGIGHWFKPITILPFEDGKKMRLILDQLTVDKRIADKEYNNEWYYKLIEKLPLLAEIRNVKSFIKED